MAPLGMDGEARRMQVPSGAAWPAPSSPWPRQDVPQGALVEDRATCSTRFGSTGDLRSVARDIADSRRRQSAREDAASPLSQSMVGRHTTSSFGLEDSYRVRLENERLRGEIEVAYDTIKAQSRQLSTLWSSASEAARSSAGADFAASLRAVASTGFAVACAPDAAAGDDDGLDAVRAPRLGGESPTALADAASPMASSYARSGVKDTLSRASASSRLASAMSSPALHGAGEPPPPAGQSGLFRPVVQPLKSYLTRSMWTRLSTGELQPELAHADVAETPLVKAPTVLSRMLRASALPRGKVKEPSADVVGGGDCLRSSADVLRGSLRSSADVLGESLRSSADVVGGSPTDVVGRSLRSSADVVGGSSADVVGGSLRSSGSGDATWSTRASDSSPAGPVVFSKQVAAEAPLCRQKWLPTCAVFDAQPDLADVAPARRQGGTPAAAATAASLPEPKQCPRLAPRLPPPTGDATGCVLRSSAGGAPATAPLPAPRGHAAATPPGCSSRPRPVGSSSSSPCLAASAAPSAERHRAAARRERPGAAAAGAPPPRRQTAGRAAGSGSASHRSLGRLQERPPSDEGLHYVAEAEESSAQSRPSDAEFKSPLAKRLQLWKTHGRGPLSRAESASELSFGDGDSAAASSPSWRSSGSRTARCPPRAGEAACRRIAPPRTARAARSAASELSEASPISCSARGPAPGEEVVTQPALAPRTVQDRIRPERLELQERQWRDQVLREQEQRQAVELEERRRREDQEREQCRQRERRRQEEQERGQQEKKEREEREAREERERQARNEERLRREQEERAKRERELQEQERQRREQDERMKKEREFQEQQWREQEERQEKQRREQEERLKKERELREQQERQRRDQEEQEERARKEREQQERQRREQEEKERQLREQQEQKERAEADQKKSVAAPAPVDPMDLMKDLMATSEEEEPESSSDSDEESVAAAKAPTGGAPSPTSLAASVKSAAASDSGSSSDSSPPRPGLTAARLDLPARRLSPTVAASPQAMGSSPASRAPSATSPSAKAVEFTVRLVKAGRSLGVNIQTQPGAVRVDTVTAGGLVSEWNQRNPQQEVQAGDDIVGVNGMRGTGHSLLEAMKASNELNLLIRRIPLLPAAPVQRVAADSDSDDLEQLIAQAGSSESEADSASSGAPPAPATRATE